MHPAQSAPNGCQRHFSHLRVYSHDEFIKTEYDMYTLMAHADGLIGDYSSASLQYLLLDRPEAYVVPDLEDYKILVVLCMMIPKHIWEDILLKQKAI